MSSFCNKKSCLKSDCQKGINLNLFDVLAIHIGLNDQINQNMLHKHSCIEGYDRMALLLRLARTETILNTQISH